MHSFCLQTSGVPGAISSSISRCGGGDVRTTPSQVKAPPSLPSRFSFRYSLKYFWPGNANNGKRCNGIAIDDVVVEEKVKEQEERVEGGEKGKSGENEGQSGNWVVKIMQVNFIRKNAERRYHENGDNFQELVREGEGEESGDCKGECEGCGIKEGEEREIGFDRDSFSRLLKKVPLKEAKMYAQLSYLGNLAYCIPKLKPGNFKRYKGLRFVTSSVEKKNLALKTDEVQTLSEFLEEGKPTGDVKQQKKSVYNIRVSAAYQIAASAAAYLQSHAKGVLPFKSSEENVNGGSSEGCGGNDNNAEILNSVTGVVAAKEEVKKAVADDLNSLHSSPCEWFICDDDQRATRYFVIQGSESLASWQANLLFEPVQFEEMDVLVHRGIYEAAKGMYEQMLPDIWTHLRYFGSRSAFRFTGHSLGGSLAMLMNLMLLIRGDAPRSSLLPVVTFGAPFIMCGGDHLLQKLALPRNHVQAITLHRDIVPRAFSSRCPNHMVELLKAINGKFRGHPCLSKQKLLYAPMGELLILQPDDKFSPNHHLLPSGSGFYILDSGEGEMLLRAAQTVFLNSPHPLEILSDRSAYGFGGTIQRDHDMNSYLKSLRDVIRIELNCIRKAKRERRGRLWWPKLAFYGIRFSRFMMSLLVIVSKLLLLGTYGIISALDEATYC